MTRRILLACLLLGVNGAPQENIFSRLGNIAKGAQTRLGLLATDLGLDPTAQQGAQSSALTDGTGSSNTIGGPEGRVPGGGSQVAGAQQCCCVPTSDTCDLFGGPDLTGLIDPRFKSTTTPQPRLLTRIVNRPLAQTNQQVTTCPVGQQTCCYDASIDLSVFGKTCLNPQQAAQNQVVPWTQRCSERIIQEGSNKQCGTRNFTPVSGLTHGQTSPGEFPMTCLLLDQDNNFIGSCAIIPNDSSNNPHAATRKVITAAHKLKVLQERDLLKVRVGEWDASNFGLPEEAQHEEYTVTRILKHPQMSNSRLSNDLAILYTDRDINMNHPYVNTACLPSCRDQFSHKFSNGTGVRCYVAGWGKDEVDGSFQFIPKQVDVPLVDDSSCEASLQAALNQQRAGAGNNFRLHPSEICAGGEVGKDACTGDGGSPLVCQATSGRWTVVGLVTWGVGCASHVPGVYARVSAFQQWIDEN